MTEAPSGSPWSPPYHDRRVHAARAPGTPATPSYDAPGGAPEAPLEGRPRLFPRTARQAFAPAGGNQVALGVLFRVRPRVHLISRPL
jgi:hypothetical protein